MAAAGEDALEGGLDRSLAPLQPAFGGHGAHRHSPKIGDSNLISEFRIILPGEMKPNSFSAGDSENLYCHSCNLIRKSGYCHRLF
jgi:hypothetical protein